MIYILYLKLLLDLYKSFLFILANNYDITYQRFISSLISFIFKEIILIISLHWIWNLLNNEKIHSIKLLAFLKYNVNIYNNININTYILYLKFCINIFRCIINISIRIRNCNFS